MTMGLAAFFGLPGAVLAELVGASSSLTLISSTILLPSGDHA